MKKIVLTGGGTAGHVSPHLAILPSLLERDYNVHYVGSYEGIERRLMDLPHVTYHPISTGKLRRYFSWQNFLDPFRVLRGFFQSLKLIGKIKPDIVFSKGGFVAVPVVWAAKLRKIPVICHESDITLGLANKLSLGAVTKACASFPECAQRLGDKGIYSGAPLRASLFEGSREDGLKFLGLTGEKPILLMMGGSQGARAVNQVLREALPQLLPEFDIVHLCGKGNLESALEDMECYIQKEFVLDELPDVLAACDLVLSRAGANAIMEFLALCKPMLLVPLPLSASRGDQILNAQSFVRQGFAHVLPQEEMQVDSLVRAIKLLYNQKDAVVAAQIQAEVPDGTQTVLSLIDSVRQGKKEN